MDGYTQLSDNAWKNDETGMTYVGREGQSLESLLQECAAIPAEYVAVEQPTDFKPLLPWQFRAMLDIGGISDEVEGAINSIPDAQMKAIARAKLEYALLFHRGDPLISMLAPAVGLTDAQIDELWHQAEAL